MDGITNNIVNSAMAMQQQSVQLQVNTSLLKKGLDASADLSNQLIQSMDANTKAMERAMFPHLGTKVDVRV